MATDASILLGYKPMKTMNPMEMYEAGQRIETNRMTSLMNTAKLDEYQQGVTEKNTLRDVYKQFGANTTENTNRLFSAGLGKQAGEYAKTVGDAANQAAVTKKSGLEATGLAMTQQRDAVNMIQSPDDVKRWLTAGYNNPDLKPVFERYGTLQESMGKIDAQVTNPEQLAQWKLTASTNAETLLKQLRPDANARLQSQTSTDNNTANNLQSGKNNAATVGASYANADATREIAKATRDAAGMQRDQATEMKLADDYRGQSKTFKEVSDAYKQITATLDQATKSPAATLAGATKFMKLLDPGSVVRESELGMALAATGVLDRATNYANTLKYGKVLTAAQTADFKNITAKIYEAAQSQQKAIDGNYQRQAKTYNLRPEMIVQDLGQNAPASTPRPAAIPSGWSVKVN